MSQDFSRLLNELQGMQGKAQDIQAGLRNKTVEGAAGGGLVKVMVNGFGEVTDVVLDPKLLTPDNLTMLRTLLIQGMNDAINKSRSIAVSEVMNMLGGFTGQEP